VTDRIDEASAVLRGRRGIVFDKDGTLVELHARWVPFFRGFAGDVAAHWGSGILEEELLAVLGVDAARLVPDGPAAVETGRQVRDRLVHELVARGGEPAAARSLVERAYGRARHGPIVPLGDVVAAFEAFSARGVSIGVATSDDRTTTIGELEVLGVTAHVSALRCGDDAGPAKPDPDVLLSICAQWSLPPSAVVFVGDSRQDLDTARAAGVAFVAVEDDAAANGLGGHADARITSVDVLARALERSTS
jgi:phosphoglycolate phosphatase